MPAVTVSAEQKCTQQWAVVLWKGCSTKCECRVVMQVMVPACLQVPELCTFIAQLLQLLGLPLRIMHALLQDCSNTLFLFSLGARQLVHMQSLRCSNTYSHQMGNCSTIPPPLQPGAGKLVQVQS